jgi:cyclopropane-fatty-acyl-phospholipid synthase
MSAVAAPDRTRSFLDTLFAGHEGPGFAVRLWDGTEWGDGEAFTLVLRHPGALRAMFWPSSELVLAEAFIRGDFEIEGDLRAVFALADWLLVERVWTRAERARQAMALLALPRRENDGEVGGAAELRGRRFSLARDRQAVRYHYDRSNEFFRLWLDERMAYTCACFASPDDDLDTAQRRKLDLVCRKLRLQAGERLLDVGCGWGGLATWAASEYGADVLGVTLSEQQAEFARERVREAGLERRVRIEVCDYREVDEPESFDKIASVGMIEHVAEERLGDYFHRLHRLLRPGGLLLNQGISRPVGQKPRRGSSFFAAYLYPDAQLSPLSRALDAAERAGFELRDVESLREHYALTVARWYETLEARRDEAIAASNLTTFRVFQLYLAGSIRGFETGRVNVHQTLLAKPVDGDAGLPLTREDLYA